MLNRFEPGDDSNVVGVRPSQPPPNIVNTMMGHKEEMKGGEEFDAFTGWKRFFNWNSGVRKRIKRQFNKRIRKEVKQNLAGQSGD